MKYLLTLLLLTFYFFSFSVNEQLLKECRKNIGNAFKEESVAKDLYQDLKNIDSSSNTLYGYKGAVEMSFGRHESGLIKRGKYFSSGKEILESAIKREPNNIELIFLRYTIQYNLPGFLGYTDNLEEDRKVLESSVDTMQKMEILKNNIKNFLKNNPEE